MSGPPKCSMVPATVSSCGGRGKFARWWTPSTLLLDIHSMQNATVPLILAGPLHKGRRLAVGVAAPVHVVCDAGHAAGTRLRDYAEFGDSESTRNALLVECGQHWSHGTAQVATEVALRFLACSGAVAREWVEARLPRTAPAAQRIIEVTGPVTIETERFRFVEDYQGMEVIPDEGHHHRLGRRPCDPHSVSGLCPHHAVATPAPRRIGSAVRPLRGLSPVPGHIEACSSRIVARRSRFTPDVSYPGRVARPASGGSWPRTSQYLPGHHIFRKREDEER